MTIRLSGLARFDLEDIRNYTVETWGRDQWLIYYRQLVNAFERITEDPDTGRDRSLFVPGMRSVNCQRHVIFFKRLDAAGGAAVILRIVHQRRNMPALVYYEDLDGG
ncbi:type II toxin-antitoxin system RelE/ParE family toxin [Primorskyibacter flagellatus]|uniref:Toxin ParE1/3/4 n=1 Tax=Primorskyibacter flagellatus TaxID=1387277 RepID=A0A1W2CAH3_9RHOB|nr:type II toxin-antitoxin system RelE/ParE family toxin [Primorskyibacter flagellatus]SMC82170.1 toxin ParE1/3/4 [Primorskyibacter flagellatus]